VRVFATPAMRCYSKSRTFNCFFSLCPLKYGCTLTLNHITQVVQHGACLGLGLAAMGTADEEICEDLKNVLYTDSAVTGEAAGIGMGLLLVGTASEKATEMLAYAHDTQHEKIIRYLFLFLL
jgi:hypothetical protein